MLLRSFSMQSAPRPATSPARRCADRVPEGLTGIAAHDERPALRHERSECPVEPPPRCRRPSSRCRTELHRRARRAGRRAGGLARVAIDDNDPRHHVFSEPRADVATNAHGRALVHPGAVVAHVTRHLDFERRIWYATACAVQVQDPPAPRLGVVPDVVEALVELAQRVVATTSRPVITAIRRAFPRRTTLGSGSRRVGAPGRTAIARYSDAIAASPRFRRARPPQAIGSAALQSHPPFRRNV